MLCAAGRERLVTSTRWSIKKDKYTYVVWNMKDRVRYTSIFRLGNIKVVGNHFTVHLIQLNVLQEGVSPDGLENVRFCLF